MGRRPRRKDGPTIDGVIVVDKPLGVGSTDVVRDVRRAAGQHRVGHTGTLDPAATGVLVVCLGRATRLVQYLQAGRKTYAATMALGRETTTQDAAGDVVAEHDASHIDEPTFCQALGSLLGEIEQMPPMASAIKVDGERLYEKHRRGETVEVPTRRVTIHDLVLEDFVPGPIASASFLVTCSAGTYVRTIAHDVGKALGVGGSLTALRRYANGGLTLDQAVALDTIRDMAGAGVDDPRWSDIVRTPLQAMSHLPSIEVDDDVALDLTHGKRLDIDLVPDAADTFVVAHRDRLVGLYDTRGKAAFVMLRPEEVATPA